MLVDLKALHRPRCPAALSLFAAMPLMSYWFCKQCPVGGCSSQSWKKAQCWDWDEFGCRKRVYEHLRRSGHHADVTASDASILADHAELGQDEREMKGKDEQNASDREAAMTDAATGSNEPKPQLPIGGRPRRQPTTPESGPPAKRQQMSIADALEAMPHAVAAYSIPSIQVEQILDSVKRAEAAAAHAQMLAASAAKAFGGELQALTSVRNALEETLLHAELKSINESTSSGYAGSAV